MAPPDAPETATPPASEQETTAGESPLSVESDGDTFAKRPEIFVGVAFVGGLALAQIMKRLGR